MDAVFRAFDAVIPIDDINKKDRSIVARIGTSDIDRFNSIFHVRGGRFDNYRKNPVVLSEHGQDPRRFRDPIGTNLWIKTDGGDTPREIIAKTRFLEDDYSQQRYEWYKDGTLRGFSIGALPDFGQCSPATKEEIRANPALGQGMYREHGGGPGVYMYRSWELTEYSTTSQPGNPNALKEQPERAAQLLQCVTRGLWIPDEFKSQLEAIARTTTDSEGGMAKGGETVKDEEDEDEDPGEDLAEEDEGEDKTKRYIEKEGDKYEVKSEKGKNLGKYKSKGGAEKRLKQVEWFKHHPDRSIAEHGGYWHVIDHGSPIAAFPDEAVARECLQLLRTSPTANSQFQLLLGEIVARNADHDQLMREYIALYTRGTI